jgi:S1-C subfamily serine protease
MKSPAELAAAAKTLGGVPIWGVLPGSAAARAGVRYGDIVLRVNGIETRTLREFVSAREVQPDRVRFDVFREGQLLELCVQLASGSPLS